MNDYDLDRSEEFKLRLLTTLERVQSDIGNIKEQMNEVKHAIHGNGRPGLLSRMASMEKDFSWAKWIAGTVGGAVGFFGSLLAKLFIKGDM